MTTKEQLKQTFANNLRYYLKHYQKTQKDLIRDLNFSSGIVSEWATAKKYPRMDHIQAIADYLQISKSQLIEEEPTSIPFFIHETATNYSSLHSIQINHNNMQPSIVLGDTLYYTKNTKLVDLNYYIIVYQNQHYVYQYVNNTFISVHQKQHTMKNDDYLLLGTLKYVVRAYSFYVK